MASKKNKSAMKRERQSLKRRMRNKSVKSAIKTAIKKTIQLIESKDIETAKSAFVKAESLLHKAAVKGILHPNNASRRTSRLAERLSKAIKAV
ncbi:MAG: 30S ribosomal protein S20 [Proteobacteria bacterium]|nr:30S ribosomal protein S20 [Pseudomonadota bacterium]